MKFVKGISLFFVIPLLTMAVGFGAGILYEKENSNTGSPVVPGQLQPKPLTVQTEAEKSVSQLPEEVSEEALMVDVTGNIITEHEESDGEEAPDLPQHVGGFYLGVYDNRVVVLEANKETIYLETDIETESLPEEVKQLLISTLWVQDEEELYSYLETFSS
ncbi:MAG: hypothetical protein ACI4FY_09575 [Acetatifactor sp.]